MKTKDDAINYFLNKLKSIEEVIRFNKDHLQAQKDLKPQEECNRHAIVALKQSKKMCEYLNQLSIKAEQHKILLAEEVFEELEEIFPEWCEVNNNEYI